MYLARLQLQVSRRAFEWVDNVYRVHQRLTMAYEGDPRLLFRIEDSAKGPQILVQSHLKPDWDYAFGDLPVLQSPPEIREFEPRVRAGTCYQFRLLANPVIKSSGKRLGIFDHVEQQAWLKGKLDGAGAELRSCIIASLGLRRSKKSARKDSSTQTHLAVLYNGVLCAKDPGAMRAAIGEGIGPAKGYGFGLLSLART